MLLLQRGCGRSSAHGAVLVTPAVVELQLALFVYALPTAHEPYGPAPEPRQRLKTDRADLSLLLFLVIVHRAGGRGGALRLSLGHQAGHSTPSFVGGVRSVYLGRGSIESGEVLYTESSLRPPALDITTVSLCIADRQNRCPVL